MGNPNNQNKSLLHWALLSTLDLLEEPNLYRPYALRPTVRRTLHTIV